MYMEQSICIRAKSLGDAWLKCIDLILHRGSWVTDDDERLIEVCPLFVEIERATVKDEIFANLADRSRIDLMLRKYSSLEVLPEYKISYGGLLYDNMGVNQVEWVIGRLRKKSETKAATIGLHHPGDTELSCLSLLDFKIRDGSLIMSAIYRSQNVFASQPGNMLALREVQEHVADAVECRAGRIELFIASGHIYEQDIEAARRVLNWQARLSTFVASAT